MLNRFRNLNRTSMKNQTAIARSSAAVIDTLEDRKLMATGAGAIGINVNDASSSFMSTAVPVMKKMGVTSVRLWYTADFNSKYFGGTLQRAIDYSNKGFDVMVIIQPKDGKVYSPDTVKSWFSWAAGNDALRGAVDRWEVGNEPDHDQYWKGSLSQYVSQLLKPASEALHAKGETVVSAGPSWDSRDVGEMINAGLLNYADMVGYHPYAKGVSLVKQRISEINAVVKGRKPIVASEWNVRGFESGSRTDWANAVKQVYPSIKGGFAYNYYFALKVQNSMAGPGGILKSDGSANTPFYNAFASFSGQSGVSVPSTGGSTSSGTSGGSTTVGTGSASISGSLWNDTDGDGNWDSNEVSSGARTVFLDYDGDGQLDSSEKRVTSASNGSYKFTGLAAGTYKVTRVFPDGFKLSNSASKYLSVSVTSGQQKTGVNIGSTDKSTSYTASRPSTSTGSTTTSGASIAGTLWNDGDGDGRWDSNEGNSGSRTVFIDSDGDGRLDSNEKRVTSASNGTYKFTGLAAGTYKVTRVFPSGYSLSNSASKYLTVALTAGQQKTGVNIGSSDK